MSEANELPKRIQKAAAWNTPRYAIDNQLLEEGYNPADIDSAWQQVRVETGQRTKPRRQFRLSRAKLSYWLHWLTRGLFCLAVILIVCFNPLGLQLLSAWSTLLLVTLAFDHFFVN